MATAKKKDPEAAAAEAPAVPQAAPLPTQGGCYTFNPADGTMTRDEGPEPETAAADPAATQE